MSFTIEKGVPVKPRASRELHTKYPFGEMEVGDSFEFEWEPLPSHKYRCRVNQAATNYSKRKGVKLVVRRVNATTGRCWRVA